MDQQASNSSVFESLKTLPGISHHTVYVVVAENDDVLVAVKPEASIVSFDAARRFFQIGFRIHVRPQEGKALPDREAVSKLLNIGHLSVRDGSRYVGQVRIPACNVTLSPWVVQEHIIEGLLIEQLINGLFERLEGAGLKMAVSRETMIEVSRERFLDMIPDNKVPLPEVRAYFGKESYYPPEPQGPPKVEDDPDEEESGADEGDND